jgi:hypothetical protein
VLGERIDVGIAPGVHADSVLQMLA